MVVIPVSTLCLKVGGNIGERGRERSQLASQQPKFKCSEMSGKTSARADRCDGCADIN